MATRKRKPKIIDNAAVFIDPTGCESLVGFTAIIGTMGGKHCDITLLDCNRKISWNFRCKSRADLKLSKAKLAAAIAMLERAGRAMDALHRAR